MNTADRLIVYCTCPDAATARKLAAEAVAAKAAACVNILPGLTSVFQWEGAVQTEDEYLLMIKTTGAAYPRLEAVLLEHHPYELPEVIAVPIERGLPGFLDWIAEETTPE